MVDSTTTLAVHRCRFVDYDPSPITALAFPPLPLPAPHSKPSTLTSAFGCLAIGHANGNIDISEWTGEPGSYKSPQAWAVRKTLYGPYPSKVDSIVLALKDPSSFDLNQVPSISQLRLFSAGGSSELLEWDIERGCVKRTLSSQGGSIWSMSGNPASTLLALGCEDGTIRLISIEDDELSHHRHFDKVKSRLLSLAWGPPIPKDRQKGKKTTTDDSSDSDDEDEPVWEDEWLVTGGSDSALRKWDFKTGRVIEKMGVDKIRGERTLVWTVGVLGNGTIVSGDSLGNVKFWDSKTCTQLQSFQSHGADVLCMAIGPDNVVYTSGVDQKVTEFTFVKIKQSNSSLASSSRWVQSCSRRMHSHDVRALAIWPPCSPLPPQHQRKFPIDISPVLASGGLDISVVLTPASAATHTVVKVTNPLCTSTECTFEESYHRRLAYSSCASSSSTVSVSRQARFLLCMRDISLSVWRILEKQNISDDDDDAEEDISPSVGWEKLLDMELNVHTNLTASAISDNGKWLVASDLYESRLFYLDDNKEGGIKPKRIRGFTGIVKASLPSSTKNSTGASTLTFSPDSSRLILSTNMSSHVLVIELGDGDERQPTVLRRFDQHQAANRGSSERITKSLKADAPPDADGDVQMEDDSESLQLANPLVSSAPPAIVTTTISADGQWLASADDRLRTHVYNLDSLMHHCTLPSFALPPQALSFDPLNTSLLTLAFPNNSFQFFDVETRQFPAWSKHLSSSLSTRFSSIHDPVLGVTFSPSKEDSGYALLWGSTWLCKVVLSEDMSVGDGFRNKRRRKSGIPTPATLEKQEGELKVITHYRPILKLDFLDKDELIVVERPLVDVLTSLPPAYFKHKYGKS